MTARGTGQLWAFRFWRGPLVALAVLVAVALAGCEKPGKAAAASRRRSTGRTMSTGGVLDACRPYLVTIRTEWDAADSVLGRRGSHVREGAGFIVAADGQRALILTTRSLVDPGYAASESSRRRDVAFRVWPDGQRGSREGVHARLVAVFMNNEDLALLRIPAQIGSAIAVPLVRAGRLAVGNRVTLVAAAPGRDFALGTGLISDLRPDNRTGGQTLHISVDAGSSPAGAVVLTERGGRLAGIVRGRRTDKDGGIVVHAVSADLLRHAQRWDYLIEERPTRRLLNALR